MNSLVILLACMLSAVAVGVASLKNMFKDIPAALIFIMLALDGIIIFGFYQLGVPKMSLSIAIALSTPLKIIIFMIKQNNDE